MRSSSAVRPVAEKRTVTVRLCSGDDSCDAPARPELFEEGDDPRPLDLGRQVGPGLARQVVAIDQQQVLAGAHQCAMTFGRGIEHAVGEGDGRWTVCVR